MNLNADVLIHVPYYFHASVFSQNKTLQHIVTPDRFFISPNMNSCLFAKDMYCMEEHSLTPNCLVIWQTIPHMGRHNGPDILVCIVCVRVWSMNAFLVIRRHIQRTHFFRPNYWISRPLVLSCFDVNFVIQYVARKRFLEYLPERARANHMMKKFEYDRATERRAPTSYGSIDVDASSTTIDDGDGMSMWYSPPSRGSQLLVISIIQINVQCDY